MAITSLDLNRFLNCGIGVLKMKSMNANEKCLINYHKDCESLTMNWQINVTLETIGLNAQVV